jgi:CIC family chloride channel protein
MAGLLAVLYNRSLLATLAAVERIGGPVELRAAVIGATVGALAWAAPGLVGGGDGITQSALNGELVLVALPAIFLFRLALGALSYTAATPGGLFAPMLVLGAVAGLGFGLVAERLFPGLGLQPEAFALVGMGAFFAGVVRAPLTGIVLVIEMTGDSDMILPLLSGCFGAMLVAELLREPPVYASLRQRAARSER